MSDNKNNLSAFHWSFAAARKTIAEHGDQELYTCASGITPSGIIHIGNFREFITVDLVTRALNRLGKKARHIHSWDDNDVFRKVPQNMPQQEMLQNHLRKCIVDIPDPFGKEESYAAKHMKDVETTIIKAGIKPTYIIQSKKYRSCDYAEQINQALENTAKIKEIIDEYRTEPLKDSWLPISIFCAQCQKDTTTSLTYNGDYSISYTCECGKEDTVDIRKTGIVKLGWRIDWPMRWAYEKVHFEPGGKDHSTSGGSYDTGKKIVETVWNAKAPSYLMFNFIKIKGLGGKISSSSGNVITLKECLDIYEPEIIRYFFAGTRPNAEFDISFDTDVLKIYEDYDKCERIYYGHQQVKEKELAKQKFIYEFSQVDENIKLIPKTMPVQISFRNISMALQIKDLNIDTTYDFFKEQLPTQTDKDKFYARAQCVKNWIEKYADKQFKFIINSNKNEELFKSLNEKETQALNLLKEAINTHEDEDALSSAIFAIPKSAEIEMSDFFRISYQAIIGKDKGPKLANFIIEIGSERIKNLL